MPPGTINRRRIAWLGAVTAAAFVLIAGRLVQIQGFGIARAGAAWRQQTVRSLALPVSRAEIVSRGGHLLAVSVAGDEVVADDFQVNDPSRESTDLAPLLGLPSGQLAGDLSQRSGFVVLDGYVTPHVAKQVAALHAPGISEQPTSKRVYPDSALAAEIIGQLHANGSGASGLEYQYNRLLAGQPGYEEMLVGPTGTELPGGVLADHPPQPGSGLELTLSRTLDYQTRQALSEQMVATGARWGSAVILDSRTGAILAMANLRAGQSPGRPVEAGTNLAVTQVFEPGSVMKLATFSAALSHATITPHSVLEVPDQLDIGGARFHDAETHPTEPLSATQILAQSSNVGTIKIAQTIGKQELFQYLRAFGFGQHSGLGFPGGSPGIVNPPDHWSATALAATAIGQDEAVNVLQLADAYNTVANGGVFVAPRLVRALLGPHGTPRPVPVAPSHRVVAPAAAAQLVGMLEQVVSAQGTAPGAKLPSWSVAGKTGTAEIPRRHGPGYQPGAYIAVFAGFAPANHPAITAVVALDRPTPIYGGSVAAPIFAQIATDALTYLGVPASAGMLHQPVIFPALPRIGTGLPAGSG